MRPIHLGAPRSLKKSELEPWLYILLNSLTQKYISYFGPLKWLYDKEALAYIFELFERYNLEVRVVPSDFPDDAGLKVSYDIKRLASCYQFRLADISRSHHGTYTFSFCRFQYTETKRKNHGVRYAGWLTHPEFAQRAMAGKFGLKLKHLRRKGGYVVGKGISCHWHFPDLSRLVRPS